MDKQDIAEEFGSFFSSVVGTTGEDLDSVNPCDMVPVCESTFKFDMIEEEDVLKILQGLDPNKAVGVDGISSKLLKTVASGISRSLTSLFNTSLTSEKVPSEWRSALVTPVHKGGDNELTGNYRPVSVLPVVLFCPSSSISRVREPHSYTMDESEDGKNMQHDHSEAQCWSQ